MAKEPIITNLAGESITVGQLIQLGRTQGQWMGGKLTYKEARSIEVELLEAEAKAKEAAERAARMTG